MSTTFLMLFTSGIDIYFFFFFLTEFLTSFVNITMTTHFYWFVYYGVLEITGTYPMDNGQWCSIWVFESNGNRYITGFLRQSFIIRWMWQRTPITTMILWRLWQLWFSASNKTGDLYVNKIYSAVDFFFFWHSLDQTFL